VVDPTIRPYRNGDDDAICDVIHAVFDEYGFTWESGGYNADTEDIRKHYIDSGGCFWVMELDGEIIATGGLMPVSEDRCELWRLYLRKDQRGKGYGRAFYEYILGYARGSGFREMEIWSDVKLTDAHHLYEKLGARYIGRRICDDPDKSTENGFIMPL
jgi:putative acetyltransferase